MECFRVKYFRDRSGSPHWTLLGIRRDLRVVDDLCRTDSIAIGIAIFVPS